MRYTKPPLTFSQQADLLLSHGLTGDREVIISRLQAVNYYRLSGYWYPFKNPDGTIKSGITIENIWRRYVFDRRLRMHVMDGIERVEVAIRTDVVQWFFHKYGPFAYSTPSTLPHLTPAQHDEFLRRIDR